MSGFTRSLLPALLLSLLGACVAPVLGLRQDPSFTFPALLNGRIVVGGVVSRVDEPPDAELRDWEAALVAAIAGERPAFVVQPGPTLAARLGTEVYRTMLGGYRRDGVIEQPDLERLKREARDLGRYVVFARIEAERIERRRDSLLRDLPDVVREFKDKDGNTRRVVIAERVEWVVRQETLHPMSVAFLVYDLDRGGPVWSGSLNPSGSRSTEYGEVVDSRLFAPLLPPGPGAYPPPAPRIEVLREAFEGFAENLPKSG